MAKSDEKTLRQLSLLSLLLDARRPVSAHEVRESVEGYACLTDQAFKKRFFDDREDLKAIGLVVQRMRDPRLGESEAYYISGGLLVARCPPHGRRVHRFGLGAAPSRGTVPLRDTPPFGARRPG